MPRDIEDAAYTATSPEQRGYFDAERGITACPYGEPTDAALWATGHDRAFDLGLASLPRFGRIAAKTRRS